MCSAGSLISNKQLRSVQTDHAQVTPRSRSMRLVWHYTRGGAPLGGGIVVLHLNHKYWFSNHVGYRQMVKHIVQVIIEQTLLLEKEKKIDIFKFRENQERKSYLNQ